MQNCRRRWFDRLAGISVVAALEQMGPAPGHLLTDHKSFAQRRQRCVQLAEFLSQFLELQFSRSLLSNDPVIVCYEIVSQQLLLTPIALLRRSAEYLLAVAQCRPEIVEGVIPVIPLAGVGGRFNQPEFPFLLQWPDTTIRQQFRTTPVIRRAGGEVRSNLTRK